MDKEEERLENKQYMQVVDACRELFKKKLQDYGAAWRILRPASVTDQIYIKVARIRSLQLSGENLVGDSIESEFIGIVNYGIIGLIQFEDGFSEKNDTPIDLAEKLYDSHFAECFNVMKKKNHDYGEAWRNMRVETITDLILTKVFRTKQIEDHDGQTIASEGIPANYIDMVNYAIFALCLLHSNKDDVGYEGLGRIWIVQHGGEYVPIYPTDERSYLNKDKLDGEEMPDFSLMPIPPSGKYYVAERNPEVNPSTETK